MAGRPKKADSGLAPLESEVMGVIWQADSPLSVRLVLDTLNGQRDTPLAYTTVLPRRGERRRYLYEATAADAAGLAVRDVLRAHGDAAVAHFVDEARADPTVLRRLRTLLAEDR
jgi:predicted transcriptional regulator